jgi:hypothetical protein
VEDDSPPIAAHYNTCVHPLEGRNSKLALTFPQHFSIFKSINMTGVELSKRWILVAAIELIETAKQCANFRPK